MFVSYEQEVDESVSKRGRPKGSSAVMSCRRKAKYENAVTEVTRRFLNLKQKTIGRMPGGILDKIIKEASEARTRCE